MKTTLLFLAAVILWTSEAFRSFPGLAALPKHSALLASATPSPIAITDVLKHDFLQSSIAVSASSLLGISLCASAADAADADTSNSVINASVQEDEVALGPAPTDFGLKYDYYTDCGLVVNHMRYATLMEKGDPKLVEVASKTKAEMNEFVSYYRRSAGVNGKQSFSLLYTSINVLAGHYTSYGVKFPVPEKRRKRLLQEYNDIEKNIRKKR